VGWTRSFAGACVLVLAAQAATAAGKQRRQWVDPPADLPTASVPNPAGLPSTGTLDVETSGSTEVLPEPVNAPTTPPQVIHATPTGSSRCATRVYTVLSGLTVRVHAC
jgi:hypothetical protein